MEVAASVMLAASVIHGGQQSGDGWWWSVVDDGCRGDGGWLISNILVSVSFLFHVVSPILVEQEKSFLSHVVPPYPSSCHCPMLHQT